jgi:hypothetical protein
MGATSVLRKGETFARSTRGEGSLPNGGDATAGRTHVSHKSKSQICGGLGWNLGLFLRSAHLAVMSGTA